MLDIRSSLAQAFCLEYLKNKFNFYTHYFKVKMVLNEKPLVKDTLYAAVYPIGQILQMIESSQLNHNFFLFVVRV